MKPAETVSRSTLDKPLGELTEEDISQLTREDCRKYLKEQGMRRPSWNKSQAIQQVISLKTLLESRPESGDAGFRQKSVPIPDSENPPNVESVSGTESASDRSKDPALSGDVSSPLPATECGPFPVENTTGISPRTTTEGPSVGQMTIFYDGKVNVYENVSPDKARLIMQLAASRSSCPSYEMPTTASAGYQATRSSAVHFPSETVRTGPPSPPPFVAVAQQQTGRIPQLSRENTDERKISHENECEGPTSRKASLQRYFEKRKDRGRFKNKRKTGGSSSSSLEIYVNQQLRGGQTSNGQSSRSGTCSPTQPNPPQTPARCSSVENQAKNLHLSVDLNDVGKVG